MIAVSNIPSSPIRGTCSSWVMFSLVHGSHTEQAYSSDGPTKDLYACSLTVVELMLMFLRRYPSVLFAFVMIVFLAIPFKVRLYCDTQIFGFISMFKLVGVRVGCMYILLEFYFV